MSRESTWYEKRSVEILALSETALTPETRDKFLLIAEGWAELAKTVENMEQQREWLKTLPP